MAGTDRKAFDNILREVAKRTKKDKQIDDLGGALNIPSYDIESAQDRNNKDNSHMGSLDLLRDWMKTQTSPTMRQTLIDALTKLQRKDILNECFTEDGANSSGLTGASGPIHPQPPPKDKGQNHTVTPAKSVPEESDREMQYVMWESLEKGNALVIGNENFPEMGNLKESNRSWANKDINNMNKLLAALGYNVQVGKNLSKSAMEKAVEAFTEQLERANPKPQSAVVYISSHGDKTGIAGTDRNILPIPILLQKLSGVLLGKPKVLIIDACWGDGETRRLQVSVPNSSSGAQTETSFPENADIFMIHSTSYGKQAWSLIDGEDEGSWFVKQLCEVVYNNNRDLEDLDTIMLRVTKRMRTMTARLDGITDNGTQSTTVVKQGVDRKLFFYPGFQI